MLKKSALLLVALLFAGMLVWGVWQGQGEHSGVSSASLEDSVPALGERNDIGFAALRPLARAQGLDPARVALGRRLFSDTRLSRDGTIACVSCHRFDLAGADGLPRSFGVGRAEGNINAPSVFNSDLNFVQFWDGRAATLEEQAAGPVHNPVEMASSWAEVVVRLNADSELRDAFVAAYPDGVTAKNIAQALASFERALRTPGAAFDRYLGGEARALSPLAQEGYEKFRDFGCISCHQGVLLGGNMFQKFGVMGDYFAARPLTQADLGRYNVTGREEDRHVFKVPSLRNVAQTAPYFHDASAATLAEAIVVMGRFQLGRELAEEDVRAIGAFLESLSGQLEEGVVTP